VNLKEFFVALAISLNKVLVKFAISLNEVLVKFIDLVSKHGDRRSEKWFDNLAND
jgi:hypothetical protein